jgi:hypothetical protein
MTENDPSSLCRASPDRQLMVSGGQFMTETDPSSLCRASPRQAGHAERIGFKQVFCSVLSPQHSVLSFAPKPLNSIPAA